ncbi:MAG: TraR/DksA C4-type zinc finger protein [Chitinispirillaceae bacterium]|nr:TraR/DksA C4-type zinc finger protein [Chitinispirillaceae bacterium]
MITTEDMMEDLIIDRKHPRRIPQQLLLDGDIERLLELAGMLHGHYCPGLALGVKAVEAAFRRLGIADNTGMEEIMAVIEGNSCVADGIQFASGCTLGNNALVYKDLGRTAATFYRRGGDRAVRVSVLRFDASAGNEEERKEGDALFEKAVKRREKLSDAESARMKELWIKRSFETAAMPVEALFTITDVPVPELPFAPLVDSQACSVCGESVMESRAVFRNGKAVCLACAGEEYRMVIGKGIATAKAMRQ